MEPTATLREAWEEHADDWAEWARRPALTDAGLLTEPRPGNGGRWDRVPPFLDLRAVPR